MGTVKFIYYFNFAPSFQFCMAQVFNISCAYFFHLKLLFIFLILFPSQVPLLLKRVVYNPLPWIRLSSNSLFPFWLLIPSHCIIQLFHYIASIIHYFFFFFQKLILQKSNTLIFHFSWSYFVETQLDYSS